MSHADVHNSSTTMEVDADLEPCSSTSQESIYDTDPDSFGTFRSYHLRPPSFTSDITLDSLCNSPNFAVQRKVKKWWSGIASSLPTELTDGDVAEEMDAAIANLKQNYFRPFENATSYLLIRWFYRSGNSKTLLDLDRLVQDVLLKPDFKLEDLTNFRAA